MRADGAKRDKFRMQRQRWAAGGAAPCSAWPLPPSRNQIVALSRELPNSLGAAPPTAHLCCLRQVALPWARLNDLEVALGEEAVHPLLVEDDEQALAH
jgi:hypothetical protein